MARIKLNKMRTADMQKTAENMQLSFKEKEAIEFVRPLADFNLFKAGIGREAHNIMRKRNQSTLDESIIFDYKYTISTGKSSVTYYQTVYVHYAKSIALPHFTMVPEKWYHRLGKLFRIDDIDFAAYPDLSKNYFLKGDDEEFIRFTFDDEDLMKYFSRTKGYNLEGSNYLFALYKHNVLINARRIDSFARTGDMLFQIFSSKGDTWKERHKQFLDEEE